MVPGLEERARFLPRLPRSQQLTPGYLDAPATALAPLGNVSHIGRRGYPEVTLVFCGMDKYGEMKAYNREAARDALEVYNDTVRRSLLAMGGYECQVRCELVGPHLDYLGQMVPIIKAHPPDHFPYHFILWPIPHLSLHPLAHPTPAGARRRLHDCF